MEFYLVDELECDLTVFHPYRTLLTLCSKGSPGTIPEAEAGEADADDTDGPRYWGTGEGRLELQDGALQMAWCVPPLLFLVLPSFSVALPPARFIINDTYRSELCLLYPPHLIAIAAIYLTLVFHAPTRASIQQGPSATSSSSSHSHSHSLSHSGSHSPTRRSSRTASHSTKKTQAGAAQPQDIIGFMAGLNVSMPLVATIAQEIIALYALWNRYTDEPGVHSVQATFVQFTLVGKRAAARAARAARSASVASAAGTGTGTGANTPAAQQEEGGADGVGQSEQVTSGFLVRLLLQMREQRAVDMAHPPNGRQAVNKMLERAQAAG